MAAASKWAVNFEEGETGHGDGDGEEVFVREDRGLREIGYATPLPLLKDSRMLVGRFCRRRRVRVQRNHASISM